MSSLLPDSLQPRFDRDVPTRWQDWLFRAKATALQGRRGWHNWHNREIRRWQPDTRWQTAPVIARSQTDLWVGATAAEWILQAGKIENLRVAIRSIDGIEIPAGGVFSFWQQVGQPTRARGFQVGRELREGCIVPTVGGGLCQLSNALYDAALTASLTIIERHAHSRVIPGSLAEIDRDATVFWNYIDLKFRTSRDLRIEARMDDRQLIIEFKSAMSVEFDRQINLLAPLPVANLNNCITCGVSSCWRSTANLVNNPARTGYLVDSYSVEFDRYIQSHKTDRDYLYLPIDGSRFRKSNYQWDTRGFDRIYQQPIAVAIRSIRSRKLARQGAARQRELLNQSQQLALKYAKKLTPDTTHLVITQSLLPWLWEMGYLGGRTFDVLMHTLPIAHLQQRLDTGFKLHPESPTLGDFRAESHLAELELAAFDRARKLITCHSDLAQLWPERTELLTWELPARSMASTKLDRPTSRPTIVLPCSSLGRKGIYELRAAIKNLDCDLIIVGQELEDPQFWQGYAVEYTPDYEYACQRASAIVLPAWVEHQPRRLLEAVAAGIPVIASTACGLERVAGVKSIAIGDIAALEVALSVSSIAPSIPWG